MVYKAFSVPKKRSFVVPGKRRISVFNIHYELHQSVRRRATVPKFSPLGVAGLNTPTLSLA
ncbi:1837_t:CDS:1, partial [Ambispora leptoticha]